MTGVTDLVGCIVRAITVGGVSAIFTTISARLLGGPILDPASVWMIVTGAYLVGSADG